MPVFSVEAKNYNSSAPAINSEAGRRTDNTRKDNIFGTFIEFWLKWNELTNEELLADSTRADGERKRRWRGGKCLLNLKMQLIYLMEHFISQSIRQLQTRNRERWKSVVLRKGKRFLIHQAVFGGLMRSRVGRWTDALATKVFEKFLMQRLCSMNIEMRINIIVIVTRSIKNFWSSGSEIDRIWIFEKILGLKNILGWVAGSTIITIHWLT